MATTQHHTKSTHRSATPAEQVPDRSVERATEWLRDLARAYGWHVIAGRKTETTHHYELHAYGTHLTVKITTGKLKYNENAYRLTGWVPIDVRKLGSYENAEKWIWKLTQDARVASNKLQFASTQRLGRSFLPKAGPSSGLPAGPAGECR